MAATSAPTFPPQKPPPAPSVLEKFDLRKREAVHVRLPAGLREVSGLAVSSDGRVFAHADERGVVAQVDPCRGTVIKAFSLGNPPVSGDFEGIAIVGERFFLMTSTGRLYETREGADGKAMPFTILDTGFGNFCELEGLAYEPSDRALLIGCKRPRLPQLRNTLTLFRWSIDRRAPGTPNRLSFPLAEVIKGVRGTDFRPSGLEREPTSGHYLVVAGPERLLTELTADGKVVATRSLSRDLHLQPEGITFLGDSVLVVADEGGTGHGTTTCYHRAR